MKVKEILKNCAVLLDDLTLYKCIEKGEYTPQENEIKDLLIECTNLTNARIASEYVFLKEEVEKQTQNGEIFLKDLSDKRVYDVVGVKKEGYSVKFSVKNGYLYTESGNIKIEFAYLPEKHAIDDTIDYYSGRVSERVFAYGVVAEYLTIKGNVDDANVWNEKFVSALSQSYKKHREIIVPRRRWS